MSQELHVKVVLTRRKAVLALSPESRLLQWEEQAATAGRRLRAARTSPKPSPGPGSSPQHSPARPRPTPAVAYTLKSTGGRWGGGNVLVCGGDVSPGQRKSREAPPLLSPIPTPSPATVFT